MSEDYFEMDLADLRMTFSGVSDQSLIDVYSVNWGDLEATVDMLSHLELLWIFRVLDIDLVCAVTVVMHH
ncbi:hypothetical protein Nepgr_014279 [Nepenthes gracilis]|uniref:CUE domain-containing protein n=1 Tax=Nepenthes gracilis TaxID=150966 RepID=A0AAD3SJA6_NEPGR|nr:hypothetical protein Nepgr_014279 [Nepenthes gracilis]